MYTPLVAMSPCPRYLVSRYCKAPTLLSAIHDVPVMSPCPIYIPVTSSWSIYLAVSHPWLTCSHVTLLEGTSSFADVCWYHTSLWGTPNVWFMMCVGNTLWCKVPGAKCCKVVVVYGGNTSWCKSVWQIACEIMVFTVMMNFRWYIFFCLICLSQWITLM